MRDTEKTWQWNPEKYEAVTYEVNVPTGHSRLVLSACQADSVAQMCMEAYEMGRRDKAKEIKSALEIVNERI